MLASSGCCCWLLSRHAVDTPKRPPILDDTRRHAVKSVAAERLPARPAGPRPLLAGRRVTRRDQTPPTSRGGIAKPRAGLTGFLAGVARSVAHANVTINFLLPGSFDTDRLRSIQEGAARQFGIPVDAVTKQALSQIPARRFGEPAEFGAACAFLCSAAAGFITGQSILIDGGAYPGIL